MGAKVTAWQVSGGHRSTDLVVRPQLLFRFYLFVFQAQLVAELLHIIFWNFEGYGYGIEWRVKPLNYLPILVGYSNLRRNLWCSMAGS